MKMLLVVFMILPIEIFAGSSSILPFAKFHGTYSVKKCEGSTEFADCKYRFVTIEQANYTSDGVRVPSVGFFYFNVKDKAPFRSNFFLTGNDTTYTESGNEGHYQRNGAPDSNTGITKNVNIDMTLQEDKTVQFEMRVQDTPKEGEGRVSKAKFILEKVK